MKRKKLWDGDRHALYEVDGDMRIHGSGYGYKEWGNI